MLHMQLVRSYNGSLVGSCAHSDACVFSFHSVKIITTGEEELCSLIIKI